MSDQKLTTVLVDGLSVETTEPGAQAISKLQTELADAQTDLGEARKTHKQDLAAKDSELAARDAKIDELEGKQLTDADIDNLVKERADLIATAKTIADKDYTGLSGDDIKMAAVVAKLGKDTVDGKSADYVSARFDILAEDAGQNPVTKVLKTGGPQVTGDAADQAHADMLKRNSEAWKGNTAEGAQ